LRNSVGVIPQQLNLFSGTIVEQGNHAFLLSKKANYFELWNKQSLV